MYEMKKIIDHKEPVVLPNCMYHLRNLHDIDTTDENAEEIDIKISSQVIKFLKTPSKKMMDLEVRQDELLKKLDILYERIKTISLICKIDAISSSSAKPEQNKKSLPAQEETVFVFTPDNLPWFLKRFLKESDITLSWHIHSSVPNEKVPKVTAFVRSLCNTSNGSNVNLRLIFSCVSANSELKLSSLAMPIIGNVNILRYLSFVYPKIFYYEHDDHTMDNLLDICHLLERTTEKNKEAICKKLFSQYKNWIHKNTLSIVDLAAYTIIKQWRNVPQYIPRDWFDKCEKLGRT